MNDDRPLPLIVAERWDFPLQYQVTDGILYYSIQDWLRGLTQSNDVRRLWSGLQTRNEMSISTVHLQYQATDGKTYQRPFTDDKGLYRIAEDMRVTKKRPALKAIKEYLADAGAFADKVRRNPEAAIEQIESYAGRKRQGTIDKLERAGYGDRPEVAQFSDLESRPIKLWRRTKQRLGQDGFELSQNMVQLKMTTKDGKQRKTEDLFGETASALKAILETDSIRDSLPEFQLITLTAAEYGLQLILDNRRDMTNADIRVAIEKAFVPIGNSLREICEYAGVHPVTNAALLEGSVS